MKKIFTLILLLAVVSIVKAQDPAYPATTAAVQNISAAEYFIDTDPGVGKATAIGIFPGINISNIAVSVNVTGLSNGVHILFLRTRNAEGSWSISNTRDFLYEAQIVYSTPVPASQNIVAAEYFIDTDPGFGRGTAISITPGVNLSNAAVIVNTTGLLNGTHRLHIRSKSAEGHWSISNVDEFIVSFDFSYPASPVATQNLIAAEYFIDSDPGFGKATPVTISAGADLNTIAAAVNTSGLTNGAHRLYLHTKNQEGRWSLTNVKDFIVDADFSYPAAPPAPLAITAAEYFIDTDPGIGKATGIAVTPGVDLSNIDVAVAVTGLSNGIHRVYLRTKNQEGSWSITAKDSFATSLMRLSADSLLFGNVPVNSTLVKNLVITNASTSNQTITAVSIHAPYSTSFATPVTLTAGETATIPVSFTAAAVQVYADSLNIQTSAGNFKAILTGAGILQKGSWSIDPANGYDYGNIAVNTTGIFNFIIRNTGNIDISLDSVVVTDPAFLSSYTAGSIVPVNGSLTLPLQFTPATVNQYTTQLKIKSATAGIDSVTTVVTGRGYYPGTPPVIQYPTAAPYSGTVGVNPAVGQTGLYTYKILYQSANNKPPQTGYPKIGIDLNGDQDFNDLQEGNFPMVKEGTGTDYVTGVVYSYTFSFSNYSATLGYQFSAVDADGNTASSAGTVYKSGPLVTSDQLDLKIFASDISFSKLNPLPGESFTVTATVTNSTAIPAVNVPIRFYRDTILLGNGFIPLVDAYSTAAINKTFSFGTDGFYPIKVWIDSSRTLNESNTLNNYAIRPVIVGSPALPGGINVSTSASTQICPQLKVLISGNAVYFGTGSLTMVAGAMVTINTGTQTITTTTDAGGNYSYLLTGVTCGPDFNYTVRITDFTFTSSLVTGSIPLPCPAPNACAAPVSQGGIVAGFSVGACTNVVGNSGHASFMLRYRERDVSNMWGLFDEILNDTLRIFNNGVLIQTIGATDNSHGPGNEVNIPVIFPLTSADPVNITATLNYTYVEYKQIPTSIYHGERTPMSASGGGSITPELNLPDLTIGSFAQTGFTSFTFSNANVKCGNAGSHQVRIYDSLPGGAKTLVQTNNIASLNGGTAVAIALNNPNLSPGIHFISIVTDEANGVAEQSESNNVFTTSIVVPLPDLSVTKIITTPTALNTGATAVFKATIKNTGQTTGSFSVRFAVNGIQSGSNVIVSSLNEKDSIDVLSDPYIVTTANNSCGETIQVVADAGAQIAESDETNNSRQVGLAADLSPYQLAYEIGSASNPAIVRINTSNQFFPAVRNAGQRAASRVTVRFTLNGNWIGADTIETVQAGEVFAAHASFTRTFTTAGNYTIHVTSDTANTVCENDETNNEGDFYIRVVESKPDFEVLSQYISPSSLNPNPGQNITLVGTVRNSGGKPSPGSTLRFLVDDIQLGSDVAINALEPGKDTTVAATLAYSSIITGVKVMKLLADPNNTVNEEREDNNEATRTMIVGDAPDLARSFAGAIRFNPSGFTAGDSVIIAYRVRNFGAQQGSAWARFLVLDEGGQAKAIDSVYFTLLAGDSTILTRKMLFSVSKGSVVTQLVNSSPMEFDLLNNNDTLNYSTVAMLRSHAFVNSDLDMKQALPDMLPGWIGGKLVLGNYDLTITGSIVNFDTAHFVVTNGTGKLKFVNSNPVNTFPIGTALNHSNFVKLTNTGAADNFSVRVVPYVLSSGNNGDTLKTGYVNRTWFIEEQIAGGSNATAQFFWNAGDELSRFDRSISRTAHFTSNWQPGDVGAAATDSIGRFSKSQDGYSSFSPFAITSLNAALPLRLVQFTASKQGSTGLLQWQTTSEVATKEFVVQHSADGSTFTGIGVVAASNRPGINNYQFIDKNLQPGNNYYRLKMTDIDGQFSLSDTRIVKMETGSTIRLFPNPAHQFVTISGLAANGSLKLLTLDGKLLGHFTTTGSNMLMNVHQLAGGLYIIQYKNHGKQEQQKLVKE